MKDHSFTRARGAQAEWLRSAREKRLSSVMQDDNLPPAVFEKCLHGRNKPIYTFSQNGFPAGRGQLISSPSPSAIGHAVMTLGELVQDLRAWGFAGLVSTKMSCSAPCAEL